MSIREYGNTVIAAEWVDSTKINSLINVTYYKDSAVQLSTIEYSYFKDTDKELEHFNHKVDRDDLIPDSVGYQMREHVLDYCKNNQDWVHRYERGIYAAR